MAGRRAVVRWAWRMFRREWRQQILVLALLTVAVGAAVASVAIAYNSGAADDAEFGSASRLLRFDGANPTKLEAGLVAAEEGLGTVDVIGHRSVGVPGDLETVDFRAQNPRGAYGHVLLALRHGGYPEGPGQVAVTDGVARRLSLKIGGTLALDGRRRTIVGVVENPRDLGDEFALVSPASAGAPDYVTVLVDAGPESLHRFMQSADRQELSDRSALVGIESRPDSQGAKALAMFSVATVFLLLTSLVAAAGFAVIAQRRLRQLGMLAAIGATGKQLRLVLIANGAVVGAFGALLGAVRSICPGCCSESSSSSLSSARSPPRGGPVERSPASRLLSPCPPGRPGRSPRITQRSPPLS
jgi:putative ABC transport system permease protein